MFKRGAFNLTTVLAVVFGLGLAASVYLNIAQHRSAENDKKLLKGEISDLRYQVKVDQTASAAKPTASPAATPEAVATPEPSTAPSPSASPAVAGASTQTKVQTCSPDAAFRVDASSTGKLISRLPNGTVVTPGGEARGKYTAVSYSGQTGYVLTTCLQ